MKDVNIVITGKNGESVTIEINAEAQPATLAELMYEHEWFRNIILQSINEYADRYINPLEFVRFLSQQKN